MSMKRNVMRMAMPGNLLSAHLCSLCLSWAEMLRELDKFSAHKSGLILSWAENF